jgi:hypothetical protein
MINIGSMMIPDFIMFAATMDASSMKLFNA